MPEQQPVGPDLAALDLQVGCASCMQLRQRTAGSSCVDAEAAGTHCWYHTEELHLPLRISEAAARSPPAQMMAFPGGKDRTSGEWAALLAAAGWRLERIVPLRGMDSVVVGAPA